MSIEQYEIICHNTQEINNKRFCLMILNVKSTAMLMTERPLPPFLWRFYSKLGCHDIEKVHQV